MAFENSFTNRMPKGIKIQPGLEVELNTMLETGLMTGASIA